MGVGIRARDLRKVYTSPPPLAAAGAAFAGFGGRKKGPSTQIAAFDGVSIEVAPGEVFGLLGILTTRVKPTSGEAYIGPFDVWREQVAAQRLIGVVQQKRNLDFALTAREILMFHSELLEQFQLTPRADDLTRGFSGDMMQRLSVARAMMHYPQVLFPDEPSTGLDPQTRLLAPIRIEWLAIEKIFTGVLQASISVIIVALTAMDLIMVIAGLRAFTPKP